MRSIPPAAEPLIQEFAVAFTRPTFQRFVVLLFAAILTTGRRTVTNLLRTVQVLAPGHWSSYHRVFSERRWSGWPLARGLAGFILRHWVPDGPVRLAGDDTVDEHRGRKVYGKACHRDAVRSTHSFTAHLGLETTRGWSEQTVLRAAPCLFGLFSVIALLYARLPARQVERVGVRWPGKSERTFSDAITAVRRWLWCEWAFATPDHHEAFSKLSRPIRAVLLYALAPAA